MPDQLIDTARLVPQSYGIACAQVTFGGPRGIWLECTTCRRSEVIVGSRETDGEWAKRPDSDAAKVFLNHGWAGEGPRLLKARCPTCAKIVGGDNAK